MSDGGNADQPSSRMEHRAIVGKPQIADLLLQTIDIQKPSSGILKMHPAEGTGGWGGDAFRKTPKHHGAWQYFLESYPGGLMAPSPLPLMTPEP